VHRLDLNEIVKEEQYQATIHDVVVRDSRAYRHMRLVLFYVIVVVTLAVIGVHFGWLPAGSGQQEWATGVLNTALPFVPAALGFAIGRLTGIRRDS
jgi:hypothetical protein